MLSLCPVFTRVSVLPMKAVTCASTTAPPWEQGLSRVKNVVDTTTCSQTEHRTDMNTGTRAPLLPEGRADR